MKLFIACIVCILTFINAFAERIDKSEIIMHPDQEAHYNQHYWSKKLKISKDLTLNAEMEISARGNGWLKIANLNLNVYKNSNSIMVYENELLDTDFTDIDGDGFKDIVISGAVCFRDEEYTRILKREPVVFIYIFDAKKKEFHLVYRNASFKLEYEAGDEKNLIGIPQIIEKYIVSGRLEAKEENQKGKKSIRIERTDFVRTKDYMSDSYDKTLELMRGFRKRCYIQLAPEDDSWLEVVNLKLNIYGEYFNTETDAPGLADIDFVDINDDGAMDITVSGMLYFQNDKSDNITLSFEPFVFIYMFDPAKKEFLCAYRNASFMLEKAASEHVRSAVSGAKAAIKNMEKSLEEKRKKLALPE